MGAQEGETPETTATVGASGEFKDISEKSKTMSKDYVTEREDLAAAFRWVARLGLDEGIANHITYCVDENDASKFLCQPFGRDFSTIKASDLVLVDFNQPEIWYKPFSKCKEEGPKVRPPIEPTAFCLHGNLHKVLGKRARCILHLHPPYGTTLSCLQDKTIPPIDQNCCRWYNRLSVDSYYGGMGLGEEAERVATTIGDNSALIMGNHGVMVIGDTVGHAIDCVFYLEKSASTYILALSTQKQLSYLSDEVAETTAVQWEEATDMYAEAYMNEIKRVLDREKSDFRD